MHALTKRTRRDDGGFTLIELMVVVLIIAILIAIAIPTFLGARRRAQERAAQSNVRNAFTAQKTHYTDTQAYTTVDANGQPLEGIEPSLTYAPDGAVANTGTVYVDVTAGVLSMGVKAASGKCFYLKDNPAGGTTYEKTDACLAPSATTIDDAAW